jgi:hypothetical protein
MAIWMKLVSKIFTFLKITVKHGFLSNIISVNINVNTHYPRNLIQELPGETVCLTKYILNAKERQNISMKSKTGKTMLFP